MLFRRLARDLLDRRRFDRDIRDELQFHIDCRAHHLMKSGLSEADARRQARLEFGGTSKYSEECRDNSGFRLLDSLRADVRYAFRGLCKNPSFAAAAVFTLALGIGANTLVFSAADAILLRPFPFRDSSKLVIVWTKNSFGKGMSSFADFVDWRSHNSVFEDMGASIYTMYVADEGSYPERIDGRRATGSFFATLGVQPKLGTMWLPENEHSGRDNVVLLAESFWRAHFAADPQIVGRHISLAVNNEASRTFTIIGVLPKSLEAAYSAHASIWSPWAIDGEEAYSHRQRGADVIARLKPGVTLASAQAAMNSLAPILLDDFHEYFTGWHRSTFSILMLAVAFVLLIACANVANLLLARGTERKREIAIRAALGAGRWRLFREALTESLVIGCMGGIGGALIAVVGVDALKALVPEGTVRREFIAIDVRVLLFTAGVSLLAGIVAGCLPSLHISRITAARPRGASRDVLVVAEVALGLLLSIAAGLMINSFIRLQRVDMGFNQHDLLSVSSSLSRRVFPREADRRVATAEILRRVAAVPGVEHVGTTDFRPLGSMMNARFRSSKNGELLSAFAETIGGDYFAAMGTGIVRGRTFTDRDGAGTTPVAIINEAAARAYWAAEEPVGKTIWFGYNNEKTPRTIVGVVRDVRRRSVQSAPGPAIYVPAAQDPPFLLEVVIRPRAGVAPAALVRPVRTALASVDRTIATNEAATMDAVIAQRIAQPRFLTSLFAMFGMIAIALTATGLYAVVAYNVRSKLHDIGVRVALGAQHSDVLRFVLARSAWLVCVGLVLGAGSAAAFSRVLASLLFEVKPTDPRTLVSVGLLLIGVALVASYLPARRATRVDPAATLRYD